MLEFIQALIQAVGKAVSDLSDRRDQRRMSEIGSELFLFYVQVNEAVMTGEQLVEALEAFVERYSRRKPDGSDADVWSAGGDWIKYRAQVQRTHLARVHETMDRWRMQLQIIDGEALARIGPLVNGKRNALDLLILILSQDALPMSITWDQFVSLAGHRSGKADRRPSLDRAESRAHFEAARRRKDESVRTVMESSIPLNVPWNQEIYEQVKIYLEARDPRSQLNEIRASLEKIREAIERNFTLKDILLRVGDRRFALRYDGDPMWW